MESMQHKGAIVEKAVRESGFPISRLAKKLGKTARWMYFLFDNPNAPLHYIIEIGKLIHYDFSGEINELKQFTRQAIHQTDPPGLSKRHTEIAVQDENYWKDKYLQLLEDYTQLLEEANDKYKRKKR